MHTRQRDIPLPVAGQVTSLELFFDLVFVFTITQLTATVLPGGWAVTGRTALLLLLLWWMYGGYAWLTIPHAYGSDRIVFACGYLLVVAVHAGVYVSEAARITRGMVVQLLGWNMAGALLGLVGALFFKDILVWWWLGSFVFAVVLPRLFCLLGGPRGDRAQRWGLRHALAHPTNRLSWEHAGQLCVGVGLFWVGLGLFRLTLGLPGGLPRLGGGVVLGAVIVVGARVSGLVALLCLLVGSAALVLFQERADARETVREAR